MKFHRFAWSGLNPTCVGLRIVSALKGTGAVQNRLKRTRHDREFKQTSHDREGVVQQIAR